ncbi:MAG: WYL domain-containing protein [Actinomycetota bacterium]
MNRTDRLYAMVEELRAVAPRARTAPWLAERFEVSIRTIERDLLALQEAGVPIWSTRGRNGGYAIDPAATLPPVNLSPAEATAIAVALTTAPASPLDEAGRTALTKIVNAMSDTGRQGARDLAARIHLVDAPVGATDLLRALGRAIADNRVVEIDYVDRHGVGTDRRTIEPENFLRMQGRWYVNAWCRRRHASRTFLADRIQRVEVLDETSPERPGPGALGGADLVANQLVIE